MTALSDYLKSRATGRSVTAAAIFAVLVVLVQHAILIPHFQRATGFVPFDVQAPLTRHMIAIQLGAFPDSALPAYLPFLAVDLVLGAASAAALMLLWSWLFRRQPSRLVSFFERGAVILVPIYTLLCDLAENVAFARLLGGLSGADYARTIEFAVTIHGVRGALLDLQVILTVLFVILALTAAKEPDQAVSRPGEAMVDGN